MSCVLCILPSSMYSLYSLDSLDPPSTLDTDDRHFPRWHHITDGPEIMKGSVFFQCLW